MSSDTLDLELVILESMYRSSARNEPLRQRSLAGVAGISLGMTNTILKRLAKKGWISVTKLNSRNIRYLVTIEGINEILNRSYRYFKRTIKNIVRYKDGIDEAIHAARKRGMVTVILAGDSDLDFILEHSCAQGGLIFERTAYPPPRGRTGTPGTLVVYPETVPPPGGRASPEDAGGAFYLSRMALGAERSAGD
jgi:DNA-binding MarR family transcriptional regulator